MLEKQRDVILDKMREMECVAVAQSGKADARGTE
jgi:hypothetical protein